MNFNYSFLLLLVVLSAYSEGPQYVKPSDSVDSTLVTVCPDSSSISLGVLAPILPQNEEYISVLPQNEVFVSVLPQIGVFEMGLVQTEINTTVLFRIATVNYCQWFNRVKTVINFVLNPGVNRFKFLPLTLVHCEEKLGWKIRISLESLHYALKMYTWSLSENQASIRFRCRL